MSFQSYLKHPLTRNMGRFIVGLGLAVLLYQFALHFATADCQTLHQELKFRGPKMLFILILGLTGSSFIGLPLSIVAMSAGVLTGPMLGGPLTSISLSIAVTIAWHIGKYFFRSGNLPPGIARQLESSWYKSMMDDHSISGFHWTATHSQRSQIPFSCFAALVGAKVPHLSLPSFVAGIFVGSVIQVAGYSLAGASIGCAVINHALGLDISEYRTLIVVSCLILILLTRYQSKLLEGGQK